MSSIDDFIDHVVGKDFVSAQSEFQSVLNTKMQDAIDQEKIAVAGAMFGEDEDNPDDVEWDVDLDNDDEEATDEEVEEATDEEVEE
tara:strand:+ start:257 stop:514 length:258 start_codon:yes stop_codon:yes gene_type:complete